MEGRDYVIPEDVQCIWQDVIAHRLIPVPGAEGTFTGSVAAAEICKAVNPPRIR